MSEIRPDLIRGARHRLGISQYALAFSCGADPHEVSKWETAYQKVPEHKVPGLCRALGVTLPVLEGTEPFPEPEAVPEPSSDPTLAAERAKSRERTRNPEYQARLGMRHPMGRNR